MANAAKQLHIPRGLIQSRLELAEITSIPYETLRHLERLGVGSDVPAEGQHAPRRFTWKDAVVFKAAAALTAEHAERRNFAWTVYPLRVLREALEHGAAGPPEEKKDGLPRWAMSVSFEEGRDEPEFTRVLIIDNASLPLVFEGGQWLRLPLKHVFRGPKLVMIDLSRIFRELRLVLDALAPEFAWNVYGEAEAERARSEAIEEKQRRIAEKLERGETIVGTREQVDKWLAEHAQRDEVTPKE